MVLALQRPHNTKTTPAKSRLQFLVSTRHAPHYYRVDSDAHFVRGRAHSAQHGASNSSFRFQLCSPNLDPYPNPLYARYLCSRDALGRPSAARDDRVSCIQHNPIRHFTPVYKHRNNTIRLTIQYKVAFTTCKHT